MGSVKSTLGVVFTALLLASCPDLCNNLSCQVSFASSKQRLLVVLMPGVDQFSGKIILRTWTADCKKFLSKIEYTQNAQDYIIKESRHKKSINDFNYKAMGFDAIIKRVSLVSEKFIVKRVCNFQSVSAISLTQCMDHFGK